jgi:hypothetical protein
MVQDAELQAKKVISEINKNEAQTVKALRDPEDTPDRSFVNKEAEHLMGKPWNQLTPEQKGKVLDYDEARQTRITGGREVAKIRAEQTTKPVDKNAPFWRNPITAAPARPGMTPQELEDLGYQTVLPAHAEALSRIETVQQNIQQIKDVAGNILRKSTGYNLLDAPKGFLQKKIIDFKRENAGDPDIATVDASLNTMLATLAKLAGDAANIAEQEQQRYKDAIFKDSDTLESMMARIKVVEKANTNMLKKMGLGRSREDLVKQWIREGLDEREIKRRIISLVGQ